MSAVPIVLRQPSLFEAMRHSLEIRWPEISRTNNQTYKGHACTIKAFCEFSKDLTCEELTVESAVDMVQLFLDYRRFKQYSACSIDNDRRNLSSLFTWLIRQRLVSFKANPAFKNMVHCDRVEVRCKRPLSSAETQVLINHTRDTEIFLSILFCLAAGLRPRGASRVKPSDLDLEGKTLRVFEKGRERIVPLSSWIVSEIKLWLTKRQWIVFHADTVGHRLAEIRELHTLPEHFTMQALRRTFLNKLFQAGVAPQMAASICGNSLEVIQKHYVSLETLNARSVVDVLDFGG